MAGFEVAEAARGQALAINQQKTARGLVNIVSEETFGAMHAGNIGYALQRLPGLTVNEEEDGTPSGVNIRGLGGDFNSFTLDGNRIGTRGFSTGNLDADGIANIEVIKAATPDRDGDAIGGIINIVSRSAFQRRTRNPAERQQHVHQYPNKWGQNMRLTYTDISASSANGRTRRQRHAQLHGQPLLHQQRHRLRRPEQGEQSDLQPADGLLPLHFKGSSQTDLRRRARTASTTVDFRTGLLLLQAAQS